MKKIIWLAIILAVVLLAGYFYFTRPVQAPTAPIGDVSAKMPAGTPGQSGLMYRIGTGSEARFSIYELLNGKDKTVVGTTAEIGGDMKVVDSKLEIGTITINARTLKTDSDSRDGAVGRFILKSETSGNEFITFTPAGIVTSSGPVVEGKEVSFSVSGNLTISGIIAPATFSGRVTLSNGVLTGTAETKLSRSTYKLVVPSLSFIANIPDEFTVGATIVARNIAI